MATDAGPYGPNSVPQYVTHTTCDGIVEIAQIDDDVALYVYCPTCQDIVEGGELSAETCYLVPMPEASTTPPVPQTPPVTGTTEGSEI